MPSLLFQYIVLCILFSLSGFGLTNSENLAPGCVNTTKPLCPVSNLRWIRYSWWQNLPVWEPVPVELPEGSPASRVCPAVRQSSCCSKDTLVNMEKTWLYFVQGTVLVKPVQVALLQHQDTGTVSSWLGSLLKDSAKQALSDFATQLVLFLYESKGSLPKCQYSWLAYHAGLVCLTCDPDYAEFVNYFTSTTTTQDGWNISLSTEDCDRFAEDCADLVETTSRINVAVYNLLTVLSQSILVDSIAALINESIKVPPFYCYDEQCREPACSMFTGLEEPNFVNLSNTLFNLFIELNKEVAQEETTETPVPGRDVSEDGFEAETDSEKRKELEQEKENQRLEQKLLELVQSLIESYHTILDFHGVERNPLDSDDDESSSKRQSQAVTQDLKTLCLLKNLYVEEGYTAHLEGMRTSFYKKLISGANSLSTFTAFVLFSLVFMFIV